MAIPKTDKAPDMVVTNKANLIKIPNVEVIFWVISESCNHIWKAFAKITECGDDVWNDSYY